MVAVWSQSGGVPKLDHYTLGPDQVPSVKLVLGEERHVVGTPVTNQGAAGEWVIRYQPAVSQVSEWSRYVAYLIEVEEFEIVRSDHPDDQAGMTVLIKPSVEDGYSINLQIQWDTSGYTLTAWRSHQSV